MKPLSLGFITFFAGVSLAQSPLIISPSGDSLRISGHLPGGEAWALQRSTNGADWVSVSTNTVGGRVFTVVPEGGPVEFFRWSRVESQVALAHIRGRVISFRLTNAVQPLTVGTFSLQTFPASGAVGYSANGSLGTYRYGSTGTNTARIEVDDIARGRFVGLLTFTDRYVGTFEFNGTGHDGWARGTFTISE